MARVLLDTTVLVDLLRGRAGARRRFDDLATGRDTPVVCAVNVEEIARGLRGHVEPVDAARLFDGLRIAPLGRAEGETAGRWRAEFARRGQTLSQSDCLIAAAATEIGARLATGNPRHFPMPGLVVEHWPAGEL